MRPCMMTDVGQIKHADRPFERLDKPFIKDSLIDLAVPSDGPPHRARRARFAG